mmetsp:Transcript_45270/g.109575  ORF Transcript_45270/g.109575 Transcript_45270/m.109575 type:complete len:244 (-) Transcript_45270:476-1207(-)
MGKSVTWVVDNVPCDPVIQESQDESWNTKSGGNEDDVDLVVKIKQINQPWSATPWFGLGRTVSGPVGSAILGTAGEGSGESVWNLELFHLNILKDSVSQSRHNNDRNGNGEIGNDSSDVITAAEGRGAKLTKSNGKKGSPKTQNETEKSNSHVVILGIFFEHIFVMRVISSKVVEKTNLGGRISNGSQQENGDNEQGKCLISESSGLFDNSVKVEECCSHLVEANPDTDPCIECEKRNVELLG